VLRKKMTGGESLKKLISDGLLLAGFDASL